MAATLISACGDDEEYLVSVYGPLVGGPCSDMLDCHSGSLCAGDKGDDTDSNDGDDDFPDGTCTVPCDDHGDCPGPSLCIDRLDGVCALACAHDSDCRGGYKCKDVDDRSGGGKSLVCIK